MKLFLKLFSFSLLFFILILETFAIDSPSNFQLDSSNGNSVTLSWDEVIDSPGYYDVHYYIQGGDEIYDKKTDLFEGNSITINDLLAGNTYIFSVITIDDDFNESDYSNELIVDIVVGTTNNNTDIDILQDFSTVNFALEKIKVIGYDKIELDFSNSLDDSEDTFREFKITNKNDNLDVFEVESTELNSEDDSKLILTLDAETKIGNEYEVVIIAITNIDGKNIESGLDNVESFNVEEIISIPTTEKEIELNSATEKEAENELNSGIDEENELNSAGPTGSNVDASEIENTTLALAKDNEKLPKTGPEHVLMLILSIVLGALIFVFKYKKV